MQHCICSYHDQYTDRCNQNIKTTLTDIILKMESTVITLQFPQIKKKLTQKSLEHSSTRDHAGIIHYIRGMYSLMYYSVINLFRKDYDPEMRERLTSRTKR
jgi:hypothetical protein